MARSAPALANAIAIASPIPRALPIRVNHDLGRFTSYDDDSIFEFAGETGRVNGIVNVGVNGRFFYNG
jgi:hypothetical protein